MKAKHRNALSWLPLGPKTPGDYEDQRNGAHQIMSSYHVMSHHIMLHHAIWHSVYLSSFLLRHTHSSSIVCLLFSILLLSCTFQPLTLYCVAPQAMKSLISLEVDCIITVLMGLHLFAWMCLTIYWYVWMLSMTWTSITHSVDRYATRTCNIFYQSNWCFL